MPDHECQAGGCREPATRRCSGCQKAWYCTSECQKNHWYRHIFECNPRRPLNSADYLSLAVVQDLIPQDKQTLLDYGFSKAETVAPHGPSYMLGLYAGLINYYDVKPQTIHKWRINGTLIQEIKNTFERHPKEYRGGYYPWFLQHQHILENPEPTVEETEAEHHAMLKRAWIFVGKSAYATQEEMMGHYRSLPSERQDCLFLYIVLLSRMHPGPSPDTDLWIKFGFCACTGQWEEMQLSRAYIRLINACTFDEFSDAYAKSSLLSLFQSRNIPIPVRAEHVADVLRGTPIQNKSVWDLKHHIVPDGQETVIPPVGADYGFFNCTSAEETQKLTDVYKGFFALPDADPLKLHEAAIGGRLLQYFEDELHFKLKPRKLYARLLKNPYPLRSY